MENLGKYLHDLREERGISYKKIKAEMFFDEDKIKLLEDNDLEALGDYGVVKSFIFNYARYLEANVDEVMAEFKRLNPDKAPQKPSYYTIPKEKKIMLSTNFLWTIAIIIIVLILGSIVFYAGSRGFLKAPDLFSKPKADSVKTAGVKPEAQEEPDSLRARMLLLTESMKPEIQEDETKPKKEKHDLTTTIPADTTDHMGRLLGDNPGNVEIH